MRKREKTTLEDGSGSRRRLSTDPATPFQVFPSLVMMEPVLLDAFVDSSTATYRSYNVPRIILSPKMIF
jgi:hypothetical protein